MADLRIRKGDWVVVCDGAKAIVFENDGTAFSPKLRTRVTYEQENPPTHEIGTDAPGRSVQSVGSMRSAMEQTDWHDQAEQRFLSGLAGRLDAAVASGEATSLILIAPPRALGVLRQALSNGLRAAVRAEIDKDYVRLPVAEIEKRLAS